MNRLTRSAIAFAICLSALAGCVDVIGFLQLGGYFVSFMSGNSTQLAVGISLFQPAALKLAAIIALFVFGTLLGTLLGARMRPGRHVAGVLFLVTMLLLGAAICAGFGWRGTAIALMVLAMGAENAALQRDGEVVVGLTYMTGTLVKMGQRMAQALQGGSKWAWLPYFLLWLGLVSGGVAGALLFQAVGLRSLWAAASLSAILALTAFHKNPLAVS